MGFKEYERNMSFLDLDLSKTLGSSRTQKFLKEIHDHIRWETIDRILLDVYPVGKAARFTTLAKEGWDRICQVMAFNMKRSYLAGMRKASPAMAI